MVRALQLLCLMLMLVAAPLRAQDADSDKGWLTRLLEDSLGGEGRTVSIDGFAGAFSSRATIDSITVADSGGVWLTLEDVAMEWTRSALLSGRVEVNELSAKRIALDRMPVPPESDLPPPEAQGFSLPELPVSVRIDKIDADRIVLGAPVLGEAAEMKLTGGLFLGDGEAAVTLDATRLDDKTGKFRIAASYAKADQALDIALDLTEGPDGITARLLDLPDRPDLNLTVTGTGTLDDFHSDLRLSTAGAERLSGNISLRAAQTNAVGTLAARAFDLDLNGDVTALFAPDYRPFFGDAVELALNGQRDGDGTLVLDRLRLKTRALSLEGSARLNGDHWPEALDLTGRIVSEDGAPVLLPLTGPQTEVASADLSITYDQDADDAFVGRVDVAGLRRGEAGFGRLRLVMDGILRGDVGSLGQIRADTQFEMSDIVLPDPALAQAVGKRLSGGLTVDYAEGRPLVLDGMNVQGDGITLTGTARIEDLQKGFATTFQTGLKVADLSRFASLAGQPLSGSASVAVAGSAALGGIFDLEITGTGTGLGVGQAQADALLAGRTDLTVKARRDQTGTYVDRLDLSNPQMSMNAAAELATGASDMRFEARIHDAALLSDNLAGPLALTGIGQGRADGLSVDFDASGPFGATAHVSGRVTGDAPSVVFTAALPDVSPLAPQLTGAATIEGTLGRPGADWLLKADARGPHELTAHVTGPVTGVAPRIAFSAALPDVHPFVPQLRGAAQVTGTLAQTAGIWAIDADAHGPHGLTAHVAGPLTGDAPHFGFSAALPDVGAFVPQLRGAASVEGSLHQTSGVWNLTAEALGPYGLTADASGPLTGAEAHLEFSARIPNVQSLVPQIVGPVGVTGSARQESDGWRLNVDMTGPQDTSGQMAGLIGTGGTLDLAASGVVPLGLADPFLRPRSLNGLARFDLALNGPPALGSLSGTITTRGARFTAPVLKISLNDIDADVVLGDGRATVSVAATGSEGGRLNVEGPVSLNGGLDAGLSITLNALRVVDPRLYDSTIDAAIRIDGPLLGGALIAGRVDVGETVITVPSSGLSGVGPIPDITHIDTPAAARLTQERAGLIDDGNGNGRSDGPVYVLDLLISAPHRIFVRGRGLDAEIGGSFQVTGTTRDTISSGALTLIRGRLDILGKRFVLDEGTVQLQGDFNPFVRFKATTDTDAGTASVVIEGPAAEPQVRFESSPAAPEEEVLSQIFFGRDLTQLSAFQALQLAGAVATLAGRGGEGIVSRLRRGFGLDDLDVTTNKEGQTELRVGKYISDNVYTDVTVGPESSTDVSINLDLTPNLTARGMVGTDENTSLGIFFEKDY